MGVASISLIAVGFGEDSSKQLSDRRLVNRQLDIKTFIT